MSDYVLDWCESLDKINPTQIVPQIDTVHGAAGPLVQRRLLSDPEVDPVPGVANSRLCPFMYSRPDKNMFKSRNFTNCDDKRGFGNRNFGYKQDN